MPFRLGELVLYAVFAFLIHVIFRDRRHARQISRRAQVATTDPSVETTDVERRASSREPSPANTPEPGGTPSAGVETPTGNVANVAGRCGLFRCEEYRVNETLVTRVHLIDRQGRSIGPSVVYRDPFRAVIQALIGVAA